MPTTLQSKFLEDENGTKFAPVTTPNAVRWPNGDNLGDKLGEKQDEISDLATIRSGAAAGATAVQPAAIASMESVTNKVTSLSAQSTDIQYPSARCVYNIVGNINSVLDEINGEVI